MGERSVTRPRGSRRRVVLAVAAGVAALVLAFPLWQWLTWPDVAKLAAEAPETTAFMERYRRRHDAEPEWTWVAYPRISPHLAHAVVASEDMSFFSHDGFDRHEMREAWREAWRERKLPRGASTLSQQVVKNLWLSPSRSPWRKLKEGMLTRELEEHLEKRRILEIHLNVAEFGPGVYGAEAAARRYFGKSASELTRHEAAQLAASLPRPSSWHPGVDSPAYARRVASIEARMRESAWIRDLL